MRPGGRETRDHVWLFIEASYSCSIANFHCEEASAYLTVCSSAVVSNNVEFNRGLTILDFDLVCIG